MIPATILLMTLLGQGEIDVKGSLGWVGFVDDSAENHLLAGGSARFYLTRRFSIEPEALLLYQSDAHHDWVFVPNFVWEFRSGRVRPYLIGGVGGLRFVQKFPGAPAGASTGFAQAQWHGTFGFGAKIYVNERWFVAPEFRIGWEPHARLSAGVGYTFRR